LADDDRRATSCTTANADHGNAATVSVTAQESDATVANFPVSHPPVGCETGKFSAALKRPDVVSCSGRESGVHEEIPKPNFGVS
jgi:hypothetical protein